MSARGLTTTDGATLCDALDRILSQGAVVRGEIVLSVGEVDLVYLGLSVLLASVDKAASIGGIWGANSLVSVPFTPESPPSSGGRAGR